jgi:hypothetical protein
MFYTVRWYHDGTPHLAIGDFTTVHYIARMLNKHHTWFKVAEVGGATLSYHDLGLTIYDYWLAPNATFPEETN